MTNRFQLESASPYKFAICLLIQYFVSPLGKNEDGWFEISSDPADYLKIGQSGFRCLGQFILREIEQVDQAIEKGLDQFLEDILCFFKFTDDPGYVIVDLLKSDLNGIETPDDIEELCCFLRALLTPHSSSESGAINIQRPTHIKPESIFGIFLRKTLNDIDGLDFGRRSSIFNQIWKLFLKYCSRTIQVEFGFYRERHIHDIHRVQMYVRGNNKKKGIENAGQGNISNNSIISEDDYEDEVLEDESPSRAQEESMDISDDAMDITSRSIQEFSGNEGETCMPSPIHRNEPITPINISKLVQSNDNFPMSSMRPEQSVVDPNREARNTRTNASLLSANQIQLYIQRLVQETSTGKGWCASSENLEDEIKLFLDMHPDLPRAHFFLHLRYLAKREHSGAIHALHRYFDYAGRKGGPAAKPDSVRSVRAVLPFAVLKLVEVYTKFGQFPMANAALKETMRIAQDSGDHECVAYALCWLYHHLISSNTDTCDYIGSYSMESGSSLANQVILRCLEIANRLQLHSLCSTAVMIIILNRSTAPINSEGQSRDLWNIIQAAQRGKYTSILGNAQEDAQIINKRTEELIVNTTRQRFLDYCSVIILCLNGQARENDKEGNEIKSHIALGCNSDFRTISAMYTNFGKIYASRAYSKLLKLNQSMNVNQIALIAESMIAEALCGRSKTGAQKNPKSSCVYYEALDLLLNANKFLPCSPDAFWLQTRLLLLTEWMINRGELKRAKTVCEILRGIAYSGSVYSVITVSQAQVKLQYCRLLLAENRFEEALMEAFSVQKACLKGSHELAPMRVQAHIMESEALIGGAGSNQPIAALKTLLVGISICESHSLHLLHALTVLGISKLFVLLGYPSRAVTFLRGIQDQLIHDGSILDLGDFYLSYAKCLIVQASKQYKDAERSSAYVHQKKAADNLIKSAVQLLKSAYLHYNRSQYFNKLLEISYLLTRLVKENNPERKFWENAANTLFEFCGDCEDRDISENALKFIDIGGTREYMKWASAVIVKIH